MTMLFQLDKRSKELISNYEEKVLQHIDQAFMSILNAGFAGDLVVESLEDIRVYQEESWPRLHLEIRRIEEDWWIIDRRRRSAGQVLHVFQHLLKKPEEDRELLLGLLMIALGWCTINEENRLTGRRAALSMKKEHVKPRFDLIRAVEKLVLKKTFWKEAILSAIDQLEQKMEPTKIRASVAIDQIDFDPRNFRDDPGKIKEFANNIERHGVLHDPTMVPKKNGRYDVLLGERRVRAAKSKDIAYIDVEVRTPAPDEVALIRLSENMKSKTNDHLEMANALQMAFEEKKKGHPNFRKKDLANLVNISETQISKYNKLLSIPSVCHQRIRHLDMEKLLIIAGAEDDVKREDLISKSLEGQTVKSLRKAKNSSPARTSGYRTVFSNNDITITIKSKKSCVTLEELKTALTNVISELTQ